MSGKEHRTNLSELKSTQKLVQLLGQEIDGAFDQMRYPPKYILAVLPPNPEPGSPNELLVRSNMPVGHVLHKDIYSLLHDGSTPGKKKATYISIIILHFYLFSLNVLFCVGLVYDGFDYISVPLVHDLTKIETDNLTKKLKESLSSCEYIVNGFVYIFVHSN